MTLLKRLLAAFAGPPPEEPGKIASRLAEGVGRIRPDVAPELVFFTDAEFDLSWDEAVIERPVMFERVPGTRIARKVRGL